MKAAKIVESKIDGKPVMGVYCRDHGEPFELSIYTANMSVADKKLWRTRLTEEWEAHRRKMHGGN